MAEYDSRPARKTDDFRGLNVTRFNLGCGLHAADGWRNLDRSPSLTLDRLGPTKTVLRRMGVLVDAHMAKWPDSVERHDVRKGLPCPDGTAEAVYSSHMLEHLYQDEAVQVLEAARRALAPGGVMRVALPDGRAFAAIVADETVEAAQLYNEMLRAYPPSRPSLRQRIVGLFSASPHRWQPTPALVKDMFRRAGFDRPEERKFLDSRIPDIEAVEHREGSIFIEATA